MEFYYLCIYKCIKMSSLNHIGKILIHNRYWIVIIVGVLLVGVVDENSFVKRVQLEMQISELKAQIDDYNSQYDKTEATLRQLRINPKAITKIARENYFMKADDEDIFVLSDDKRQNSLSDEKAE